MPEKRDSRWFENWTRRNQMKPFCRVTEKHGDILIADSGDCIVEKLPGGKHRAFYRTGFALDRPGDQVWVASTHEYDALEFPMHTPRGAQEKRVNEALVHGRIRLQQTHEAGLYRGNDRPI